MRQERWLELEPREQLRAISAELMRAQVWQAEHNDEKVKAALERGIELIDLSLNDRRWRGRFRMLFGLRDELAEAYCGKQKDFAALRNAF